ncbi:MAG: CPBP family intramembrane metalloprotease [Puniceicoccales bacterium]|nr:CPBP family intramembrane metalloprotease [Puniceicoccales bacterium]
MDGEKFLKNVVQFPFCSLVSLYFISLLVSSILAPLIFNLVVYWDRYYTCDLTVYCLGKGFVIFFERIRLISFLCFFPLLWKIYRQQLAKRPLNAWNMGMFLRFWAMGSMLIFFIFGIKMLCLRFSWNALSYWFIVKSLLGAILIAFLEEWLFRGLILNILLQNGKTFFATLFSSFIFAYFHFRPNYRIDSPQTVATLADGFHCFYEVVFHSLVGISWVKFLILFAVGYFLAMFYVYVQELEAPIGLHGGIVVSLTIFRRCINFSETHSFWGSNDLLNSPCALVLIIFIILLTHFYYFCCRRPFNGNCPMGLRS